MVILHNGFDTIKVWIECEGQPLPEHMLKSTDAATQSCFIPSTEGKVLRVGFKCEPMKKTSSLSVVIDGVLVAGVLLRVGFGSQGKISGQRVSETSERPFMFGRLQLTEDSGAMDPEKISKLGTIQICVKHVHERNDPALKPYSEVRMPGEDSVNEKMKKSGGHAVRLDKARDAPHSRRTCAIPAPGSPIRQIIFQYAPIDFLYAQEIIPRPLRVPSPESKPVLSSSTPGPSSASKVKTEKVSPSRPISQVKVKKEEINQVKKEEATSLAGEKRALSSRRSNGAIDISSGEDDGDVDTLLTPEDKAAYTRIKKLLADGRKSKHKKPKLEPTDSVIKGSKSREVIVLSD